MLYCTKCGTEWPEGVHYCGKCGIPLLTEPDIVTSESTGSQEHMALNDNTAGREGTHWDEVASPIKLLLRYSAGAVLVVTAGLLCLFVILIATAETGDNLMWAKILTIIAASLSTYNIYMMPEDVGGISRSQKITSIGVIAVVVFFVFTYLG